MVTKVKISKDITVMDLLQMCNSFSKEEGITEYTVPFKFTHKEGDDLIAMEFIDAESIADTVREKYKAAMEDLFVYGEAKVKIDG